MNDKMNQDEKLAMCRAMRVYGGSFVKALSECFILADSENQERLEAAFPEYVEQYREWAKRMEDE